MQNKKYKSKKRINKRLLMAGLLVVVLIIAGGIGWKIHHDSQAKKASAQLSPSAKIEQKLGQQQAEQKGSTGSTATGSSTVVPKGSDSNGSGTTQTTSGNVTPSITYPVNNGSEPASAVEVDAFIPGILENGGTCSLTLSKGSQSLPAITDTARLNGQTTSCPPFHIPSSSVTTGTWTATVAYSSASYQGTSNPVSFIIN